MSVCVYTPGNHWENVEICGGVAVQGDQQQGGYLHVYTCIYVYGVATISRLLKIDRSLLPNILSFTGLFCKRDISF